MARQTKPLTNTEIKAAKAIEKDNVLYDGGGLELLIKHQTNSKLWRFRYYKPSSKKRAMISLGSYPDISLADARRLKDNARALLASNIDPLEHKKKQDEDRLNKTKNTFFNIAKEWFVVKSTYNLAPNTLRDIWLTFERHVFPAIGNKPVIELTARDCINALEPAFKQGKTETVRRAAAKINEVMDYATHAGFISTNPAARITRAFPAPQRQNMPTIRPEELPEFMTALSNASIETRTRLLIEWQLLTISRPADAASTKWSEIDFEAKEWTIPAEKLKQRREHVIPLSQQAISVLEAMQPASGHREYVFPCMGDPKRPMHSQTANQAIKRMGYAGKLVAHGLRSIASTAMNEEGFSPDIIEAALSHVDKNQVRSAYNRSTYIEQRRPLMAWWGNFVEQAATGNFSAASGIKGLKVVGGYE
ncbi:integrase domain-containing protein [Providencia manganoxydans]|uniref:integrase domain-containing protein n=1 Tax=Providencia manganoxydans TaxID=2923283 RepID=UPI0034DD73FC